MASSTSEFEQFLYTEAERYKGISYPVRSSFLRRRLVKKISCAKIHPNPDDEFCMPEIGPNWGIISNYTKEIRQAVRNNEKHHITEPILVERIYPGGYMILNGHHRWAAAIRAAEKRIPARIVNLTRASDVKKMVRKNKNNKRATLDLDEIIFLRGEKDKAEKSLGFPLNRFFKEPMRLGVPALIHFLRKQEYDIWVYSAKYFSVDYLQRYFRYYGARLDGIITGLVDHRPGIEEIRTTMDQLVRTKYPQTIHIDSKSVLCIDRVNKKFREYELSGRAETWAGEIMDSIRKYEKDL